jgi:gluconate 2-dehydrogenase gamma chain
MSPLSDAELLTRRSFVEILGVLCAAGCLAGGPAEVHASLARAARSRLCAPAWEVFTPGQAATVDAIACQIMPTDDTPGAREAGVVFFIDHSLGTWAGSQRDFFLAGLEDLDRRAALMGRRALRFAQLSAARQVELLRSIETTPFFQVARFFTLMGMFSLPIHGGNRNLVGWKLIGYEHRPAWQPPFGYYDAAAAGKDS